MKQFFKYLIALLTLIMIALISYGFYIKNHGQYEFGDKLIGLGVLGTAFVVMPAFIAYRYAKKDVKSYMFPSQEASSKTIAEKTKEE